jgi:tetratricopeptide (TPR) repeat protein
MKAHIPFVFLALIAVMVMEGCKAKKNTTQADSRGMHESGELFDNYFIDACAQANNGNYDVALKLFAKCRDLKPEEASVYYEMSKLYDKMGDKTMSMQNAMKAWQISPENKFYALWYATTLRQNSQTDQAIEVLDRIFSANQKDEYIARDLDYLYAKKGELSNSREATSKRIALWNTYQSAAGYKLSASLKLIELYKSQKDYTSAHRVYDEIKKASPGKYQYFIDDANLYLEHGDEVNANINFEKAVEINPNNWKINYALYNSYRKKNDLVKAEVYLKKAFADVNTSFENKISACIALNAEVKTDTNIRYLTNIIAPELLRLYPDNANAVITAAKFYQESGNIKSAYSSFQRARTLNPNLFDAWMGAINCSEKLGLYNDMVSLAEQALEYYPNVSALYATAAKGYNALKEYGKALDYCVSGKSFALDNEAKYLLLMQEGFAHFNLKKYADAEKAYEAAMAINQAEKELYDQLGNVKFFLNKTDEAVSNWRKAKEMGLKNNVIDKKINERKFYE